MLSQYYSLKMFTLLVLFVLCSFECVLSSNQCSKESNYKYDISDGRKEGSAIIKDGVRYEKQNYYSEGSVVWGCVCDVSKCIRKCCAEGQYPLKTNNSRICTPVPPDQVRSLSDALKSKAETKNYNVVHGGIICNTELSLALPATNLKKDLHYGILDAYDQKFDYNEFCLDYVRNKLTSIICVNSDEEKYVNTAGMIISMPFLLVTFIVYALLPERNLHMKALMCYVINLLHAYIFLVTIQLTDEVIENTACAILGFCCIFFFLSSFFWMNVICIDIFLGFRGFRGIRGAKSYERKRFLWYCLYAWGMSLVIVGITFLCNQVGNPGQWFYPGVAVGQCFLRNGIPELLYFYGPMGIIIVLNVVLFTLTAIKIRQVKKDTAMLKHSESKRHSDDDQQNFNLYFKLLLAMGVNWSMELVSWAVNMNHNSVPQYIWYLSDFCNATYGVFIFFIFVFKRNIWKQLKRRYYSFMGKHHLAHSMATTNQTKTTNDSMATSVNDRIALEESELNVSRIN